MRSSFEYINYLQLVQDFGRTPIRTQVVNFYFGIDKDVQTK